MDPFDKAGKCQAWHQLQVLVFLPCDKSNRVNWSDKGGHSLPADQLQLNKFTCYGAKMQDP